jgi:hypothetical protein
MLKNFLIFFAVYFSLGLGLVVAFSIAFRFKDIEARMLALAMVFRLLCTYGYYYRTFAGPSDATGYWAYARDVGLSGEFASFFQTGTKFIDHLSALFYPAIAGFDDTYLMLYIPFSLIAFAGSVLFYRTLVSMKTAGRRLPFVLSFFLPNLVFWSSNLGKDSIMYFGIVGIIFSLRQFPKVNIPGLVGFGAAAYFVRPHIIGLMLISVLFGLFLQSRKLTLRNIVFFVAVLGAFLMLQERIFKFAGIHVDSGEETMTADEAKRPGISRYYDESMKRVEGMSGQYQGTGAHMASGPPNVLFAPYYLIAFVSMPFLWQARTPIQLVSAVESVIYQYFLLMVLLNWKTVLSSPALPLRYPWIIYFVFTSVIYGMSTSNFGLGVREKCMVLPVLILFYAAVSTVRADRKRELTDKRRAAAIRIRDASTAWARPGKPQP